MTPPSPTVPFIPDNAPFTAEQRAYLNGFLAALFSRVPAPAAPGGAASPVALTPLTVLFGSQTGNAEKLAKRIAKEAGKRGFAPMIQDLAKYPVSQLAAERQVLLVTSTYGDGEPPDSAKRFWKELGAEAAPRLAETKFSVLALGDMNYTQFCAFGKRLDACLESLGAQRAHPRMDCDVDFEAGFQRWLGGALGALSGNGAAAASATPGELADAETGEDADVSGWSRSNPFLGRLVANRRLSGEGSGKDVRHFEVDIRGSGLTYAAGDAFGVWPTNAAELVNELLGALGLSSDETVAVAGEAKATLRERLTREYEITRLPLALLQAMAERTGDATLLRVVAPDANGQLTAFLRGREIIDLLLAHPAVKFAPEEFLALLRKLQPRLYSISSSPKLHPDTVHLTVAVVRYESLGRRRAGVCSTFLAERGGGDGPVPVYLHPNAAFKPPADPAAPLIMVGPGTGIAPFRAFLQERQATGATGRNWLFFGDQRAATDFLYREELESLQRSGTLARLDTAFSRDQEEKVYVQHRMLAQAGELFDWLEKGASFCVCGDASRMARDVDEALHRVVERGGGRNAAQAKEYVERLQMEKRYVRDVY